MAHILVVDDDPVTLKVVEQTLRKGGHVVITAGDGHVALEKCAREVFDLVITDANMPGGVSGFNLALTLRKDDRFKGVPIMFLSGRREKTDVLHAVDVGADDYVVKPIDPDLFLSKVDALLRAKEAAVGQELTAVSEVATVSLNLEITGVSTSQVQLVSATPLAIAATVRFGSALWEKIKIESPRLRIISCIATDGAFAIKADFDGLNEKDQEAIRQWAKGKKAS